MKLAEGTFQGLAQAEIDVFKGALGGLEGSAVEIGCLDGFSTAVIISCSDLFLTSIDPFIPDSMADTLIGCRKRFHENVTSQYPDRSLLIDGYSLDHVAGFYDKSLALVFIDGDHRYDQVLADYNAWSPKVEVGGLLAIHDSRMSRPGGANFHIGPSRVADEQIYGNPGKWEIVGEAFSLTLARRKI